MVIRMSLRRRVKRIEEEAQRRGYRPNAAARRLKTGRANAGGVRLPDRRLSPEWQRLQRHAAGAGSITLPRYDINLLLLADKQQSQATLTRLLRSGAVDALIVGHTTPEDSRLHALLQTNFRFLALGRSDLPSTYAWFDVDHLAGSQLAVGWSLAQGRQRIAWLGSNENSTRVRDRRQGYLTALGEVTPYAMAAVAPSRRAGYQQTREWLAEGPVPEVIITDCAALAEGAALALQLAGRAAGEGAILLAGWEGLREMRFSIIPLSPFARRRRIRPVNRWLNGHPADLMAHRRKRYRPCGNPGCNYRRSAFCAGLLLVLVSAGFLITQDIS
ncbi:Raffinose operon repressor [Pantoea agglomerans]|uniref:Raffinose operon repressor n=1 Tax=Enterobacter agglomerans TaxID=549 RepID=A0A379A9G0_ENTAG|nr:Raffinose operon repressor [Pantoea agglomerans]